jgi:hypothetical protein
MIDDTQRALLSSIVTTIGSLVVRCVKDPIALGSVSTLSLTLGVLLSDEDVSPAAFSTIYQAFCDFPHSETSELRCLFGGCLKVCQLAVQYDQEEAMQLSSDLYSMWRSHQESHLN